MRLLLKGAAESLLVRGGLAHLLRNWYRDDALVLAYHNIVSDDVPVSGERSLHLPRHIFAQQLDLLMESHEVVGLEELTSPCIRWNGRPRAVITFDDAYQGALEYGLPELCRRGLPATVFVAPDFNDGRSFWWDLVAEARGGYLNETLRSDLLDRYSGSDHEVRGWAQREGVRLIELPSHSRAATMDQLQEAARRPGITLASHSWSHLNLTRLDPGTLRAELTRPLTWLQEHFQDVIPWLSYPYGLSNPIVEESAIDAGYSGAVTVTAGWTTPPIGRPLSLPRLNIPAGLSANGFALRTAGLFRRS